MKVQEYVDSKPYTTLKVGGEFRYFAAVKDETELPEVLEKKDSSVPLFMLGGGSNIVLPDGVIPVFALKMDILGFEVIEENNTHTIICVGAGENWDSFVKRTVDDNLSGIEALSSIPGTVGATPVQNVGAYGQEVKNTILSVNVYDTYTKSWKVLSSTECKFGYRDSIFKAEAKGRYIITRVTFKLSKKTPEAPNYPGVKKYFDEKGITNPTIGQIREAIIEIRRTKLPDPREIRNVGSFFKNPIVPKEIADTLLEKNPTASFFRVDDAYTKIPAGWLVEHVGLKGQTIGPMLVYPKNALVLVNQDNATRKDVENARDHIISLVREKTGIIIEPEPEFL